MMTIMMMMMMIMTDPFTTNLVVKGPVVKGSVVKGAHPVLMIVLMMIIIRERRPSCFDITRPTYNLLLTPVSNELAEKLPEDLQE